MTTSASASRRRPRTVIRSGSPGPPPTRATPDVRVRWCGATSVPSRRPSTTASRMAAVWRGSRPRASVVRTATVTPSLWPVAGVQAVAWSASSERTHQTRWRSASAEAAAVGFRVAGGDQGVPGVGEVALRVRAPLPGDLARVHHGLDGGGGLGGHEEDVRARRDQRREAALGDLAAAEDDHAAAGEAEAYGVGGVFGHEGAAPVAAGFECPDVRILECGGFASAQVVRWLGVVAGHAVTSTCEPPAHRWEAGSRSPASHPRATSRSPLPSRTSPPRASPAPCSGPAGGPAGRPCPRPGGGRGRPGGAGPAC